LYGRNSATYKMALAKVLLKFSRKGQSVLSWDELSKAFFEEYLTRLSCDSPMPQLETTGRLTVMERLVAKYQEGVLSLDEVITKVGADSFNDVIRRFHNVSNVGDISNNMFYEYEFGKTLILKDEVCSFEGGSQFQVQEIDSRWNLLEGAFLQKRKEDFGLANDLRKIYLQGSSGERRVLTSNIPFLIGYQGNACFYCGLELLEGDIHVDHVLPRQVVNHDQLWNLVLAHSHCNEDKSDKIIGEHFIKKLIFRNENIMGSDHPWKNRIKSDLGATSSARKKTVQKHYERVGTILGWSFWGGNAKFNPKEDVFFRRLVTLLSNKNLQ
jgi:5-methylcytosine-specific restriction endonuclease McrA